MGSRSKWRGWRWGYGKAGPDVRAEQREQWPPWRHLRRILTSGSRMIKRINRARRGREPKSMGEAIDG